MSSSARIPNFQGYRNAGFAVNALPPDFLKDHTSAVADDSDDYIYPSLEFSWMASSLWTEELCRQIEQTYREHNHVVTDLPASPDGRDSAPLYKYRQIDRAHDEWTEALINDAKLWSPSVRDLNDPLEAAVALGYGGVEADTLPAVTMFYQSQWCGCICFSFDPVCIQMWAHYAANHSGFLLKYEREDNGLLRSYQCRPVKYRRRIPMLDILNDDPLDLLYTKSEAWEYEREVRLQYPRTGAYTATGLLKPAGIIFGLRTSDADKDFLRSVSGDIREGQIVLGSDPYQLKVFWHD